MESSRYELVTLFESGIWMRSSPVEVRSGAIIYDNLKGMHCLQLALVNTSPRRIVSVHVEVECYDGSGNRILPEPVVHIYQNTLVEKGEPFGMDDTFYLNSDKVAEVKCFISKIIFLDGAVWRPEGVVHVETTPLSSLDPELRRIFDDELAASLYASVTTEYLCMPVQHDDYWVCVCGRANENADKHCARCGMNRTFILQTLNVEHLDGIRKEREERVRKAEQEMASLAKAHEREKAEDEPPREPATVRVTHEEAEELEGILPKDEGRSFLRNKIVIGVLAAALLGSIIYIVYLFTQNV